MSIFLSQWQTEPWKQILTFYKRFSARNIFHCLSLHCYRMCIISKAERRTDLHLKKIEKQQKITAHTAGMKCRTTPCAERSIYIYIYIHHLFQTTPLSAQKLDRWGINKRSLLDQVGCPTQAVVKNFQNQQKPKINEKQQVPELKIDENKEQQKKIFKQKRNLGKAKKNYRRNKFVQKNWSKRNYFEIKTNRR